MSKKGKKDTSSGKKVTMKQAVAILAIVLLVLMYVVSLILAIFDQTASGVMFRASLVGTFAIPQKHTMADFDLGKESEDKKD